jgi:transposase-like protein
MNKNIGCRRTTKNYTVLFYSSFLKLLLFGCHRQAIQLAMSRCSVKSNNVYENSLFY